jgi:hypothetical protein
MTVNNSKGKKTIEWRTNAVTAPATSRPERVRGREREREGERERG